MASTDKKGGRKSKSQAAANAQRIKAVVRKLPPTLPEEIFWKSCEQWVNPNTIKDKWFRPGNLKGVRLGPQSIMSRAYIAFNSPEQLSAFSTGYDGHIFRDKQGNEYTALVSYAPSQKLPANPKADQRQGTIDDDEEYKSFLALLEKGEDPAAAKREKEAPSIIQDPSKPESTPLLDALLTASQSKSANSKSAANSKGAGHKSAVAKSQKAAAQKAAREDDVHFSRAQPIVPSGPVTLLTPSKSGAAKDKGGLQKAATSPVAPKSPLPRQVEKPQGKGKGKEVPRNAPTSKEQPQQSKDQAPTHAASGAGSTPKKNAGPAADDSQTTPKGKRKKKPSISAKPSDGDIEKPGNETGPAGTNNTTNSTSTAAETTSAPAKGEGRDRERDRGRERGKGRGGRGSSRGGPPVVVIPKILTKALQQEAAKASTPTKSTSPGNATAPTSTSESKPAPNTTSADRGTLAEGSTDTKKAEGEGGSVVVETASASKAEDAVPSDSVETKSTRGEDRGRRPFFRGRGRGRGRGGPKPGAASGETPS